MPQILLISQFPKGGSPTPQACWLPRLRRASRVQGGLGGPGGEQGRLGQGHPGASAGRGSAGQLPAGVCGGRGEGRGRPGWTRPLPPVPMGCGAHGAGELGPGRASPGAGTAGPAEPRAATTATPSPALRPEEDPPLPQPRAAGGGAIGGVAGAAHAPWGGAGGRRVAHAPWAESRVVRTCWPGLGGGGFGGRRAGPRGRTRTCAGGGAAEAGRTARVKQRRREAAGARPPKPEGREKATRPGARGLTRRTAAGSPVGTWGSPRPLPPPCVRVLGMDAWVGVPAGVFWGAP